MTDFDHTLEYLCSRKMAPTSDSVLILGSGPSNIEGILLANRESIDLWGCNAVCTDANYKALFNMHHRHLIEDRTLTKYSKDEIRATGGAFVSLEEHWDLSDNPVAYPIGRMMEYFHTRYFANAICYMIALAIYMGYERIMLYGIDYNIAQYPETIDSRPCVEWWLGRAIERGIKPQFPETSHLMSTTRDLRPMYGYESPYRITNHELEKRYTHEN